MRTYVRACDTKTIRSRRYLDALRRTTTGRARSRKRGYPTNSRTTRDTYTHTCARVNTRVQRQPYVRFSDTHAPVEEASRKRDERVGRVPLSQDFARAKERGRHASESACLRPFSREITSANNGARPTEVVWRPRRFPPTLGDARRARCLSFLD